MRHRYVTAIALVATAIVVGYVFYSATSAPSSAMVYQGDFNLERPPVATSSRVHLTGDVFLGRDVERTMLTRGDDYPLQLFDELPSADAIVINFESAIPQTHVPTPDMGMRFSVRAVVASALHDAGVTHAGLANNHTYDHGASGYRHTRAVLREAGVAPFGHPSQIDSDVSVAKIKTSHADIAIVGMHTLYGQPSLYSIAQVYEEVAPTVDIVLAYVHWGEEYEVRHGYTQRRFAEQLVEQGFDIIIGHHPHVVQGIEMIDGVPVVYSLGNTVFDQYFSTEVQRGLVATLHVSPTERALQLRPITSIDSRVRPRLMGESDADHFLDLVAARGQPELAEMVRQGWIVW